MYIMMCDVLCICSICEYILYVCFFMHVLACICRLNIYLQGHTNKILESCEEISLKIKNKVSNKFN